MSYRPLEVRNSTESLALVRQEVDALLAQSGFTAEHRRQIVLAVDEAVANVIEHAYGDAAPGSEKVLLYQRVQDGRYEIVIEDRGTPLSRDDYDREVDLVRHVAEGRKGGLGMVLINRIMDEVSYSRLPEGTNRLVLRKISDRDLDS